jgi:hypothetical protein
MTYFQELLKKRVDSQVYGQISGQVDRRVHYGNSSLWSNL